MNRINPALFSAAFSAWVREAWPGRPDVVAIDGKTSRRSHDRGADAGPIHLVSAFATTRRLVLGQEAVPAKANELAAIPALLARLAEGDGLKGALVSVDAIATNAAIAQAIRDAGADYLLAVKANQPTLRGEVEAAFAAAPPATLRTDTAVDKGHGRIERRTVSLLREVGWLRRRAPLPGRVPPARPGLPHPRRGQQRARHRQGPARPAPKPATTSPPPASPPPAPPRPSAGIGGSRTACIGCSTSSSATTSPASGRDTGPGTWPSSATSPSTSSASANDSRSIKLRRKLAGWNPEYLDALLNLPAR